MFAYMLYVGGALLVCAAAAALAEVIVFLF